MNPEIQFKVFSPDYSGMKVSEYAFGEMEDWYGERKTYCLDVISEEGEPNPGASPVVLFIHGGGFTRPCDKRQAYIPLIARELVKKGFVVVSPDYPVFEDENQRDERTGRRADQCCAKPAEAVGLAVSYLKNHEKELGLDLSRMAIMGGSAGGMTAFYAIADNPSAYRCFVNLWGAPNELPELTSFPPVLSVHGTVDQLVPYELEEKAQEELEKAGISHRLITLEGSGHTPLNRMEEFMPELLQFVERHL